MSEKGQLFAFESACRPTFPYPQIGATTGLAVIHPQSKASANLSFQLPEYQPKKAKLQHRPRLFRCTAVVSVRPFPQMRERP
jgi:hypothetical protein